MSTVERAEDGRRELRWTIVGVLIALGPGSPASGSSGGSFRLPPRQAWDS